MPVPNLPLPPDQNGYQVQHGTSVVSSKLDGGASRFRADQLGAAFTVVVQWTLNLKNWNYLSAFYRTTTLFGSLPFTIDLMLDGGDMQTYTVHFLPDTFNLVSQSGHTWVAGATLEAIPDTSYAAGDAAIIAGGIDA